METIPLKEFLDRKQTQYEQPDFIPQDPISIPHRFSRKQDIEIAGLFAALLAWGNRRSILNSCNRLLEAMDQAPYEFICGYQPRDLRSLSSFVHRTFNATDLFHLLRVLQYHYTKDAGNSLESAFSRQLNASELTVENALTGFHAYIFDEQLFEDIPARTRKHIATPARKSACKRLNMYLRWMVRPADRGVDLGIWKQFRPAELVCPLDLHVGRVARHFGLLRRPANDWLAATELTAALRRLDPSDPVKYDFALFGLGVVEKF
ncbi:TIGR02757 family protein [Niabella terrae]